MPKGGLFSQYRHPCPAHYRDVERRPRPQPPSTAFLAPPTPLRALTIQRSIGWQFGRAIPWVGRQFGRALRREALADESPFGHGHAYARSLQRRRRDISYGILVMAY